MKRTRAAVINLHFNPENDVSCFKIRLVKESKILSAHLDEKNKNSFWVNFLSPAFYCELEEKAPYYEYEFCIVKANNTFFMVDDQQYLATFWIGETAYTVLYKNLK